jgi:amylosucrase
MLLAGWLSEAVCRMGVPRRVRDIAGEVLSDESIDRRELFAVRLERWWPDLFEPLEQLYGPNDADALAPRLVRLAADAFRDRPADLAHLDLVRTLRPDWFQAPEMVGYAAYVDRFSDDLAGLGEHVDYLRELGITYLHLMPLLKPRDGDSDGGYAVADYRAVRADLGTFDDLRTVATVLRASGISLVLDLVLNHVAREHSWAVAARAGDPDHRRYFHIYDDRSLPDAYEQTLPEVFPDFAPGNFTWDDELGGWVWTTFNRWQWDLNWANPQVLFEFADLVLFLANAGVEILRLDAVAFLWKRMGTDSQNQPEVHAITQALRALARIACPALLFKAEAIVGPSDLVHYLGHGHHYGKVSDLAYHNTLMVQIWSMLASGDVRLATHALRALPPTPTTTAWISYVRCHDDIGWAIDDRDAEAVGLNGHAHRAFLADYYAGEFPGSTADGLVFQYNPVNGDRRISGTTASLAGAADDRRADELAVSRILLAHTIQFGWGGIPVIWSGDELATLNDPDWATEPGHELDNRWAHRPRISWEMAARRHDPDRTAGRVFEGLVHLGRVRAGLPHLHAAIQSEVLEPSDPGVLPVLRRHPIGNLLQLYNVTAQWRPWPVRRLVEVSLAEAVDVLHGTRLEPDDLGDLWLPPYSCWWLVGS